MCLSQNRAYAGLTSLLADQVTRVCSHLGACPPRSHAIGAAQTGCRPKWRAGPPDFDAMTDVGGQAKLIKRGARVPAGHDAQPAGRRPTAGPNGQLTVATPRGKNGSQAEARRPRPNTLSLLPFLPTDILYLSTPRHPHTLHQPWPPRVSAPQTRRGRWASRSVWPPCRCASWPTTIDERPLSLQCRFAFLPPSLGIDPTYALSTHRTMP